MKLVIDSNIPYIEGALDPIAEVEYLPYKEITNEKLREVDGLIIRTCTHCNAQLLDRTDVRFIASATAGFDHIDTQYCEHQGIKWINAPACNALAVTQYIASVLSYFIRYRHLKPAEKTIGIVGVGAVGSRVKALAKQMGFNVLLNDPPRARAEGEAEFVSLDEICHSADIITFHTPLTFEGIDKTLHLAGRDFFDKLRCKPIIINAARGEIIDTKALTLQVKVRKISHLIIDCWENEPEISRNLLAMTTLATPHIAGYSADGKANAAQQCVRKMSEFYNLYRDNWKVYDLPFPITLAQLRQMKPDYFYLKTFDVERESRQLKLAPELFEYQRTKTALRREPKAYFEYLSPDFIAELGDFWAK
ncbi:MAG: 4-phosphoerythronate dehydrogenase [Prevotellaceae bacterium]|jgi:erythronate-4-phosphate dehydrogenase|nr:4-phosphoerythronate dehydrogenase [Prevotellaceae bacterium]